MTNISVNDTVISKYPSAVFGSLLVKNVVNKKHDQKLNERKKNLQIDIETTHKNPIDDEILQQYIKYFKKWNKSYPIDFQIKSIRNGRDLPNVSVLVDSMFHVEMKNRILTSGHDLDEIIGNLEFNLSTGDEKYIKIDGNIQQLKIEDIYLHDEKDILANVLYGPAKRSAINLNTKNALYLAWSPEGLDKSIVRKHLTDLCSNLELIYGKLDATLNIL